jgi:integrase/recombinase XerD
VMSKKYLSEVEAEKLLSTPYNTPLGNRDRLFLRLLLGSGLRRAEALAVRPVDIGLVEGFLRVEHGKGDKKRVVPVDRGLLKALLDYAEYWHIEKEERIFPFSLSWASHMVKTYGERAGIIGVHTHTLRHTFAIQSIKAGRSLNVVQHDLGHANLQTTGEYLKITAEDREREHTLHPLPWEKRGGGA